MTKSHKNKPPDTTKKKTSANDRLKRALVLLTFNLIVISCLLYATEALLWLRDPARKLGKDGFVDGGFYTWGHHAQNNKYGFRERNFTTPKPKGLFRIMVLGDSLVWSVGLPAEQRFTNQLELLLNESLPNKTIEVLNFGIMGGPTIKECETLEKYKNIVEPDLVVLGFCLNDTQPRSQEHSIERKNWDMRYGYIVRAIASLMYNAHLHRVSTNLVKMTFRAAELTGAIPTWQVALDHTYMTDSPDWIAFIEALRQIKKTCNQMQIPAPIFAVLNQGTSTVEPTDYANPDKELSLYLKWYHQAEHAAKKEGFATCNFEKQFATELSGQILAVNKVDAHPSGKMNAIYAKKLADIITPILNRKR